MSFNNALKKVLGLGDYGEGVDDLEYFEKRVYDDPWHKDDDEKKPRTNKDASAEGNDANADGQPAQQPKPAYTRVELPRQEVDMTGLASTKGEGVPENILKRLMNIINGNLSPHILNHLNVEAETQSIVESLRPQFRDYESNLRKEVLASAADRWNKERAEIIEKLKETDDKAQGAFEEIEELKDKIKNTENSRKSTLTRYNDLQKKMQDLMTAKEKTDMENRSLQNKMKVLQNNEEKGSNVDKAKEELLKLNDELTKERQEAIKSKERIAQLQKQVDELKAGAPAAAPAVASDANISAALKEKDEEIDNLAAQVAWLHRRLDQANEDLDKANEELAQAEQLVAEIDKFEEIKNRKDEEIAALKKKILESGDSNSDDEKLKVENEKLKAQVEKLSQQLAEAKQGAKGGESTILDDLDDGINFTAKEGDEEDDKNQMSLF